MDAKAQKCIKGEDYSSLAVYVSSILKSVLYFMGREARIGVI